MEGEEGEMEGEEVEEVEVEEVKGEEDSTVVVHAVTQANHLCGWYCPQYSQH